MTNVFIFHGIDSHPEDNWFPWLRSELESLGCRVIVPQFPTGENQTRDNWLKVFEKYLEFYNEKTITIGHSLGGKLEIIILEEHPVKIRAAYMDAVYIGVPPEVNYQGRESFEAKPHNWELIRTRAGRFYVLHSDNDPYVSLGNGRQLADHLGAELTIVHGAGHFNTDSGYTKFEPLLEKIRPNI